MRYLISIILLLPFILGGATLPQCIKAAEDNYAAKSNPEIFRQISDLNSKSIKSKLLPQIDLTANYQGKSESTQFEMGTLPFDLTLPKQEKTSYEAALNLSQTIYDGGMISRNVELTDLQTESRILEVGSDLLQHKILVANLYYQMLLTKKQKDILILHKEDLSAELRKVQAGIKAGILDKNSSLLIQDQLWQLAEEVFKLNYHYLDCEQKLSELTLIDFTETDTLEEYQAEIYLPEEIDRPELKILNIQKRLELSQSELSGSGMLPQIVASAAFAWGNPGYDIFSDAGHTYYRAGVYFTWHLWDWQSNRQICRTHKLQAEAIANKYSDQKQNIDLILIEKDNEINRLNEVIKIQTERQELLTQVTDSYAVKLQEGVISTEDYLQQFNKQKEIELELTASELEISFQRILKLFIMGGEL